MRRIQQLHAGCVAHICGVFAGETEPDIILGQHDMAAGGENLGLVVFNPEKLGQTEAGQRGVAGDGKKLFRAQARVDLFAFRRAALIAPENGGAKRPAVFVQQRDAVHLAAQADGGNGFRLYAALGDCFADAGEGRLRPVVRVLFRPAVLRREKRIGTAGAADRTQLIVVENDLYRARAQIDSE